MTMAVIFSDVDSSDLFSKSLNLVATYHQLNHSHNSREKFWDQYCFEVKFVGKHFGVKTPLLGH